MCIGSLEKHQGQCTEPIVATQCIMHWAQVIALHGSSIGCVNMSKHTGHGLELTDCALLKEILNKDGHMR